MASQSGQGTGVLQGAQRPQLEHRVQHILLRWGIHKMKLEQVLDAQRFQQQDHIGQVGALDFRKGCDQHFVFVLTLRVETEALAGSRTSGPSRALIGIGLTDGVDLQGVHTNARIVHFQFAEGGVDDENDAVDRQRRLGDVGGHDALAHSVGRTLEDFRLQFRRQLRIDGQDRKRWRVVQLNSINQCLIRIITKTEMSCQPDPVAPG